VESHLRDCAACKEVRDRLALSRERLLEAARAERETSAERENAVSRLWDNVRFRIRQASRKAQPENNIDLRQLRSILVSMCGSATADGALRKALPQDARFAKNLGSIVEVMCGTRAARFVEHAAESAREDMVA
jgi:hypothetical protein